MAAPPELPQPTAATYSWMAFLALCGAFMRANRWQDKNGKILWYRVASEIPIAIALGAIAVAAGAYWNVSSGITGGIAGLMGLVGPAAVVELLKNIIRGKIGGRDESAEA